MKSNSKNHKTKKRSQSSKEKGKNQPQVNSSNNLENIYLIFPKDKDSNSPKHDRNNSNKSENNFPNDFKEDALNEEYAIIQKVWEDLNVTYNYRAQFDKYIKTVSGANLKNIIHNEKKYLVRFKESLMKLSKEISSRENNIKSLKTNIVSLLNGVNYFENEEDKKQKRNKESIILDIVGIIKSLRLNSVNVIKHFLKVREILTQYTLIKKIDMKAIKEDYNYDENYLKKMVDDMAFLKKCKGLQKYFAMNNGEIDAFLTNFAPRTYTNENYSKIYNSKVKIPVSEELNKYIEQCRYILIQESFFYRMRNGQIRLKSISPHNPNIYFFKADENDYINDAGNTIPKNQRKKMKRECKSLFLSIQDNNQILNKKNLLKKSETEIMIDYEEKRDKMKSDYKIGNNLLKENSLSIENEELNKQLNEVCYENEELRKEIEALKKYVKNLREKSEKEEEEREAKNFRKNLEIKKMEEDHELKLKDIQRTKTLMEQSIEEKEQKINEMNNLIQQQETIIEEKNNQIDEMNERIGRANDKIGELSEKLRDSERLVKKMKILNSSLDGSLNGTLQESFGLKKEIKKYEFLNGEINKTCENLKRENKKLKEDLRASMGNNI